MENTNQKGKTPRNIAALRNDLLIRNISEIPAKQRLGFFDIYTRRASKEQLLGLYASLYDTFYDHFKKQFEVKFAKANDLGQFIYEFMKFIHNSFPAYCITNFKLEEFGLVLNLRLDVNVQFDKKTLFLTFEDLKNISKKNLKLGYLMELFISEHIKFFPYYSTSSYYEMIIDMYNNGYIDDYFDNPDNTAEENQKLIENYLELVEAEITKMESDVNILYIKNLKVYGTLVKEFIFMHEFNFRKKEFKAIYHQVKICYDILINLMKTYEIIPRNDDIDTNLTTTELFLIKFSNHGEISIEVENYLKSDLWEDYINPNIGIEREYFKNYQFHGIPSNPNYVQQYYIEYQKLLKLLKEI